MQLQTKAETQTSPTHAAQTATLWKSCVSERSHIHNKYGGEGQALWGMMYGGSGRKTFYFCFLPLCSSVVGHICEDEAPVQSGVLYVS